MRPHRYDDVGQAFPIYITVVAGLLFLAFAYLAVGQAAATRNSAQTAADAAALAAAQDTRDKLAGQWKEVVLDPTKWQDILDGRVAVLDGCPRADQLAAQNGAHRIGPCVTQLWDLSYKVKVETDKTVGDSIVPGTENTHAQASAKAVIEPLCKPAGDVGLPKLTCRDRDTGIDRDWDLDPHDPGGLPEPKDLFDVHLAD
ncbi:pilus assembly protein TadG-related protein [Streptomyces sp. NPDC001107]